MRLPCLQHIKRKFKDCGKDPDAEEVVNLINRLYHNNQLHTIGEDGWTEEKERKEKRIGCRSKSIAEPPDYADRRELKSLSYFGS